ncbi:MAG: LptE family protein [Pirellulaceae bacterium]|nr:LptE family protein [Pirellulaceae bacterium]
MDDSRDKRLNQVPLASRQCLVASIACLLSLLLPGCTAYQVGNQSLYPAHIRTVYVPTFDTASYRRDLGERLTEAVIKEIELKTPYKVVNTPDADSVLTAYLVSEGKRVVAENRYDDPRQIQVNMKVQVNWTDRRGQPIGPCGAIELNPEPSMIAAQADMVAEVGHSDATTQQKAISRAAEQIVAMMEAPW